MAGAFASGATSALAIDRHRGVGCAFCTRGVDDSTAALRVLVVDPRARGHALGRRLVEECVRFAWNAGYTRIRLWTVDTLVAARKIYVAAGFTLESSSQAHLFGQDLEEQYWARALS